MLKTTLLVILIIGLVSCQQNGGYQKHEFNAANDQMDELALQTALSKISQMDGTLTFQKVVSCYTQIVAGMRYKLVLSFLDESQNEIQYQFTVFIQQWANIHTVEEVQKVTQPGEKTDDENGNSNMGPELEKTLVNACEIAIKQRVNRDLSSFNVASSELMSNQVVQGNLYVFKVDFANKNDEQAAYLCEIWSRPWLSPAFSVTKVSDFKTQEQPTGGQSDYNFDAQNDANDMQAFNTLVKYVEDNNKGTKITNVIVHRATVQVVAGEEYRLWITYEVNGYRKAAEATILSQPWNKLSQVTSFKPLYM